MDPTLKLGDVIGVATDYGTIRRGDIVVFKTNPNSPIAESGLTDLVKRVIGLPGETIESTPTQQIEVDGQILSEPYLPTGTALGPPIPQQVIPAGDYFVLGDNRTDSSDSRFFGPVAAVQVVGVVTAIVSPPVDARALGR